MTLQKANTRAEYTGEYFVVLDRLIQATCDSGYKGTGSQWERLGGICQDRDTKVLLRLVKVCRRRQTMLITV